MGQSQDDAASRQTRLDDVLAEYLERIDRGEDIDTEQFADEHPDLTDELRSYFEAAARIEELAVPFENTVDIDTSDFESKGEATDPTAAAERLDVIRYFGDYEILEEVARGGMGWSTKLGRPV